MQPTTELAQLYAVKNHIMGDGIHYQWELFFPVRKLKCLVHENALPQISSASTSFTCGVTYIKVPTEFAERLKRFSELNKQLKEEGEKIQTLVKEFVPLKPPKEEDVWEPGT